MPVAVAYLFHSHAGPVPGPALVAQIAADWPDLPPATELSDSPEEPLSFELGDDSVFLMHIPLPIGDDLPHLVKASRLWPNARPAPDYQAHTIVTVLSPDGSDPLAQAATLTQVMTSAIAVSGTVVAVYWGAANHVILPELFADLAKEMLPEPAPLLWVALNGGVNPATGKASGFTQGMDMLGLMDIEIPDTDLGVEWVMERLQSIADYQIKAGPVIGDGDTIGVSADDRSIVAVYAPSELNDGRTVLRLQEAGPPRENR